MQKKLQTPQHRAKKAKRYRSETQFKLIETNDVSIHCIQRNVETEISEDLKQPTDGKEVIMLIMMEHTITDLDYQSARHLGL